MKKKILFISSDRADFNLQKDLIIKLQKNFNCYLFCTGTHFSKKFGKTIKHIENSKINKLIFSKIKNFDKIEHFKLQSIYLNKFNLIMNKIKPNLIILFGDRSEILISSFVAYTKKIKIAHFYGGEKTEGSLDDKYRDAISALSNYHFTSNFHHKKNLIGLGIKKKFIFSFGSLISDVFSKKDFYQKKIVAKKYQIKFNKYNYVLTLHPDKENKISNYKIFFNTIKNLKDTSFFICRPNNDIGNDKIIKLIKKLNKTSKNIYSIKGYGTRYYFSLIKHSNGVIGNSSSGISEVPSLQKPSINIGNRQKGRPRSISVIDCNYNKENIIKAINLSTSKKFLKEIKKNKNPFYQKNALSKTINKITEILI